MASTYSILKIELMATGENSTTWGTIANTNFEAIEESIASSADVTFASADATVSLTNTNALQTARNLRLRCTGTTAGARNLVVPTIEKPYLIKNDCADTITVKTVAGTGVAVPAGKAAFVYVDGTNVVDGITHLSSLTLGTALPIASGGTAATTAAAAATSLGVGTGDSPQFTGVNIGHATDTTVTRTAAGDIAVEGNAIYRAGGTDVPVTDGGTGASSAAAAATNLGLGTANSPQFTGIELGHATDTTLTRVSAGVVAVEGTNLVKAGAATASGLTQSTARILGRTTAATGAIEEISVGTGLSLAAGSLSATAATMPAWGLVGTYTPSGSSAATVSVGSYKEFLIEVADITHSGAGNGGLSISIGGSTIFSSLSDSVGAAILLDGIMYVSFRSPSVGYGGFVIGAVAEFPGTMTHNYGAAQGGTSFTQFSLHIGPSYTYDGGTFTVYGR